MMNTSKRHTVAILVLGCFSAYVAPLQAKKSVAVQLTAELKTHTKLKYRFVNNGKEPITLGIMSCSTSDNWSIDGTANLVWPGYRGCDKNICRPHRLKNKESLDGNLELAFLDGAKGNGIFRLHFKGCTNIGPNWKPRAMEEEILSEPIRIK